MDDFITKASSQAVSFAIRSGISLASGYAIRTVTKFVDKIPEKDKAQLNNKIHRVKLQINIVSPSIELIKSMNAGGFSSLQSCNELIDQMTQSFREFDDMVEKWSDQLSNSNTGDVIKQVNKQLDGLIDMIDQTVPLLNLCIVTSGINLNRDLSEEISINKLIEASNIILGSRDSTNTGPVFDLTFFSVFYNPSRLKYIEHESGNQEDETPI
ncbi:Ran-binding-domain-containing protein, partial [Yamadazyma tenuis ATCC 10573]